MQINSARMKVLRARNLRSARRSRMGKVLRTRTTLTNNNTRVNSLLNSSASTSSATKSKEIAMYEKIESSANKVQDTVKEMIAIGKMSYTDDETGTKARQNDEERLLSDVKSFVSDFNVVQSALQDLSGSSNLAFKKSLDTIVNANAKSLEKIGITVAENGELSIDAEVFGKADIAEVKKLFAAADGFADKVSAKMETIELSAAGSVTALNKLYGATSTYSPYGTSNSYYNGYGNYGYNNYGSSSSWYI